MTKSERFRQPEKSHARGEKREKSFSFPYQHPDTGCENDGQIISKKFKTISKKVAEILAENEKVICDGCGVDYRPLFGSKRR